MLKINILGNGFDIAHGHKSSYSDFKEYILNKNTDDQVVDVIKKIIKKDNGYLWKNIEENLPMIIEEILKDYGLKDSEYLRDREIYFNGDPRKVFQEIMSTFGIEFLSGIRSMDGLSGEDVRNEILKPKQKKYFIDNFFDSIYTLNINFNYIETEKDIYTDILKNDDVGYKEKNFLETVQVHGMAHSNFDSPVFGNSMDLDINKLERIISGVVPTLKVADDKGNKINLHESDGVRSLHEIFKNGNFKKDSVAHNEKIVEALKWLDAGNDYYKKVQINVYGHSLGKLDMLYFETIIEGVSPKKHKGIFYGYSDEDKKSIENFIHENELTCYELIDSKTI